MSATHNPFRAKAERARARYEALSRPTAHEAGMAQAFPLGAGFGRRGSAKRIERSIDRAGNAIYWHKRAAMYEAQANAFDAGTINAQGRRISPASISRSEKRETANERRAARIAAAKALIEGKEPWEYSGETWADAHGYLGGSGRRLVIADHAELVARSMVNIRMSDRGAP